MGNITRTCIVDTIYALSLYLLRTEMKDIKSTIFFVGNAIPLEVRNKLENVIYIDTKYENYNNRWKLFKLHFLLHKKYYRLISKTSIYAQDHLAFSSPLISNLKYTLLEDAPNIFSFYKEIKFMIPYYETILIKRLVNYILRGCIQWQILGTNNQCINRIITSPNDIYSDLIKDKEYELVNMNNLWNQSNDIKKKYIADIFGIKEDFLKTSNSSSTIYFSQPLMNDCKLSEKEIVSILSPYINKYLNEGLIIKPHPRDNFDYIKYFPGVQILDCKAPMQLLSAMNFTFKRAITICSSAISSVSDSTEVIWIGSKIHPKIYAVYGNLKNPRL